MQADELDILFEGRHKGYGAYMLRRQYPGRLKTALLAMLLFCGLVAAWALLTKKPVRAMVLAPETKLVFLAEDPKPVQKEQKKPEIPKKPVKSNPAKTQAFINNIAIVQQPTVPKIRNLDDSIQIDNRTVNPPVSGPPIVGTVPGPPVPGVPPVPPSVPDGPLETAEFMPEFPGGMPALRRFLEKNLQMPSSLEPGDLVSVKMKFVVGADGKLRSFETLQDGGADCNREVIRVLKQMPDWKPGRSHGRDVSVYYILPVTFTIPE